jgi:hypothetical protein
MVFISRKHGVAYIVSATPAQILLWRDLANDKHGTKLQ